MSSRLRRGDDVPPRSSNHSTARRPTRGPKIRYVESDYSEDDGGEETQDGIDEGEGEEEDEMDGMHAGDSDVDIDAEGEAEDMELDDDDLGEEDADGDIDMDAVPIVRASNPAAASSRSGGRALGNTRAAPALQAKESTIRRIQAAGTAGQKRRLADADDDEDEDEEEDDGDDDDELSEAESMEGETNLEVAGDEDAEGEDDDEANIEGETEMMAGEDEDEEDGDDGGGEQDADGDSDEGSRAGTPDLTKMTRRQRARFEETPQEYMKLSDEVQAKKVFTAEELSMRRQEMARRRRNLSDKRNEEVKAETINKLLKRQAPKTTKKNAQAEDEEGIVDGSGRSAAMFIRWTNSKQGTRLSVTNEILDAPVGTLFGPPSASRRPRPTKMVEEVA
ncbi:hypothetical protein SEPCBS57363_005013 [Sporothrix epigloea]|uniref:INO80 complex subunit B-like conserved region domain-containing protein n=1 Tax=Sporothrix epigloea TaxID=1892477 RepID=A0ABP0DWD1_9PEZI